MNIRGVLIIFLIYFIVILAVSVYLYSSAFIEDNTDQTIQKKSPLKRLESNKITAKDETNPDYNDNENTETPNAQQPEEQEDYSQYSNQLNDFNFENTECSQAELDYRAVCCDQKIECETGKAPLFLEAENKCLCETLEKISECLSLNLNYLNDGKC